MSCLVRRLAARQFHHPRGGFRRQRRLARLTGLVAQKILDPCLDKPLLPPSYRRPAHPDALRDLLCRVPIRRGEHMRARSTCLRDRLRSAAFAVNCSRSAVLNNTHTVCAMVLLPNAMAGYHIYRITYTGRRESSE
jgi:hypothetical protein